MSQGRWHVGSPNFGADAGAMSRAGEAVRLSGESSNPETRRSTRDG